MLVAGLQGPEWANVRALLNDENVEKWLEGRATATLSAGALQETMSFDVLRSDPGPLRGLRETIQFRQSLMLPMFVADGIVFGDVIKFEDSGVLKDRFIMAQCNNRDVAALIMVDLGDGTRMLRASVIVEKEAYQQSQIFIAMSHSDMGTFSVVEFMRVERDCDFCAMRSLPCECDLKLRSRLRGQLSRQLERSPSSWPLMKRIGRSMSGAGCIWVQGMPFVRIHTVSGHTDQYNRIQRFVLAVQSVRKRVLVGSSNKRGAAAVLSRCADAESQEAPSLETVSQGSLSNQCDPHEDRAVADQAGDAPSPALKKARARAREVTCEICNATFASDYHLDRHRKGVHLREKNFACPQCPKRYSQRGHLSAHMNTAHSKGDKVECGECGAKFMWRANLLRHMQKKHGSNAAAGPHAPHAAIQAVSR